MTRKPHALRELVDQLDRQAAAKVDAKLVVELSRLRRIWEGSREYGIGALIEAFALVTNKRQALPLWLARAIHTALVKHAPKQPFKHYRRWRHVRKMRDKRPRKLIVGSTARKIVMTSDRKFVKTLKRNSREIGYEETFQIVAERLKATPAAGTDRTIRDSYERVEKSLPESERYPRTYRRRK